MENLSDKDVVKLIEAEKELAEIARKSKDIPDSLPLPVSLQEAPPGILVPKKIKWDPRKTVWVKKPRTFYKRNDRCRYEYGIFEWRGDVHICDKCAPLLKICYELAPIPRPVGGGLTILGTGAQTTVPNDYWQVFKVEKGVQKIWELRALGDVTYRYCPPENKREEVSRNVDDADWWYIGESECIIRRTLQGTFAYYEDAIKYANNQASVGPCP